MGVAEFHRIRIQSLRKAGLSPRGASPPQKPPRSRNARIKMLNCGAKAPRRLKPAFLLLLLPCAYAQPGHPNYDDDLKPLFARRCLTCHSAGEMRAGLNLEAYSGVLKGGGSGEIVVAGRPVSSMLYKVVAH